ncbi:MAG TPA: hypothetical protein VMV86_00175 [Methanosarcinales archaeon]|nr:hypothetical protein [Methanosarcinales archaeon]
MIAASALKFISFATSVFFKFYTWYKIYQVFGAKYALIRPIFADDIKNSETKFDDKAMKYMDTIFIYKK